MDQRPKPDSAGEAGAQEGIRPGALIAGKYLVNKIAGAGGMCVVAAATNLTLEQVVAIKVLRHALSKNEEMVARFMREARSAARLKTEHVARVFDVGALDTGEPYMVMEYLEGQDLGVVLDSRGAVPLSEAVEHILQACEAMAEAHCAGIVHRDLKPENLFLTRRADGEPAIKVLDFGIAKAMQRTPDGPAVSMITKDNSTFGTPTYMSPEQIREARDVDARSDIFALGVLLYELSSGRVPFHGSSVADLHAAILMQQPTSLVELNPKIPAEFAAVVAKCLAKDRFERFQNVAELARALVPFAPPRAKQYGDRISRIIHASTAFPSLSAQFGGPDSAPGVDRSSESGRLPKVRLALSGSGAYRVTPSDAVRISNPEGGLDSGRDSRELVETLVPVRSSHPPPVRRSRLPVVGIGVAVVAIAVTALVLLATLRTGGSVAAGADVAPPDPLRSEASTPSGPPSAVTVVDIASAASGLPIADSGAPSKPQPVRPAAATTATGGSGIKVSKPPPAKTDEFDPYGTRK